MLITYKFCAGTCTESVRVKCNSNRTHQTKIKHTFHIRFYSA